MGCMFACGNQVSCHEHSLLLVQLLGIREHELTGTAYEVCMVDHRSFICMDNFDNALVMLTFARLGLQDVLWLAVPDQVLSS